MKITRILAYRVELPLHEVTYKWSGGKSVTVFDSTIVRVETDTGLAGHGEVCPLGPFYLPAYADGVLQVAVSNPFDTALLNAVQFDAKCPVQFALAPRAEVEKALKKYYGVGAETLQEMSEDEPLELELASDKEITEGDQEASVIKFVNQIIWEAFKARATDIHFEPAEDELRIRNRIDGILHQIPLPPQLKRFQAAIISRIKVMSGMNIAEKRLPQDGRINVRIKGEEIDIRVSTVPTVYGESVSLRLLLRGKIFLSLDKLGFPADEEAAIRDLIVKPHGIMLVTGPTGSMPPLVHSGSSGSQLSTSSTPSRLSSLFISVVAMPAATAPTLNLPRLTPAPGARMRTIAGIVTAPQAYEGEGFPVRRAFAGISRRALDPFIHMDQRPDSTKSTRHRDCVVTN